MLEAIGWLAGALTTASFVPQVLHALRTRNTAGISVPMYAVFCIGVALWTVYGVYKRSLPIVATNVITLVLAALVLAITLRHRAAARGTMPEAPAAARR
jgi:MtN3 and saliva related transmembrane protein